MIGGTTTQLTSAAHPFSAAAIGNHIRITSGTGFTTGIYEVVSVSGVTATMDRSVGTAGSTAGHGNLGGALASLANLGGAQVSGNAVWITGTFSEASAITLAPSGTDGSPITYRGYSATRGDGGQATLTYTGLTAVTFISFSGQRDLVRGMTFDGAGVANLACFGGADFQVFDNCKFLGGLHFGLQTNGQYARVNRCLATGNGGGAFSDGAGFASNGESHLYRQCVAKDNGGSGFACGYYSPELLFCISQGNTRDGCEQFDNPNAGPRLISSTFDGNGRDGAHLAGGQTLDGAILDGNLFTNNTGYGIAAVSGSSAGPDYSAAISSPLAARFTRNAFYANGSGARSRVPVGADDITLLADPYTDRSGGDFSLNLAIGGGLLVRGMALGYGLRSTPETSAGILDAGAVPTSGIGTGSIGSMRSLWREYCNERDTVRVPDSVVDEYLDDGLEALNRRIQYYWQDESVSLVAGTQEYSAPSDCVYVQFITWNGRELAKSDVERWRSQGKDWRNEPAGEPAEFAVYANRIILRPTPSQEAVNAAATLTVRCNTKPGAISTYGPAQLASQDWRVPVYRAVAIWGYAQPGTSTGGLERAQAFDQMFSAEVERIKLEYEGRRVAR